MFDIKKALVFMMVLCLLATVSLAEGDVSVPDGARIVKPMTESIDLGNVPDGEYPAAFDLDALDGDRLTLTLFTVDSYDIVDISTLAVGDYIVIDGQALEVDSLEKDEYGDLLINGGMDGEGYDLRAYDEDNCWRVAELDDYPTWTEQGEVTLPLADDVKYTDSSDIDGDAVTGTGIAEMVQAVEETGEDGFDEYDTTVRIEAGKIVEIVRVYAP